MPTEDTITEPLDTNAVLEVLDKEDLLDDKEEPEEKEEKKSNSSDDSKEDDKEDGADGEDDVLDGDEEIELSSEDKPEEELEYVDVPSRKIIKEKFPELFKTFPGIERAIYRESRYAEIFPTVKQASDAKEDIDTFNSVKNDLYSGNIENILATVKQNDPKAFAKIGDSLIETLGKVDQPTQFKVATYIIKSALKTVHDRGKKLGTEDGEQLVLAARIASQAIFQDPNVTGPDEIKKEEENPREKELTEREKQFNQNRLETAVSTVTSRTSSLIKRTIEKYIDPRESMNSYVRSKAVEDAMSSLDQEISGDTRFRHHLNQLWMSSAKDNYSEKSLSKIRETILNRAKNTVGGHIKKARAVALKGLGASTKSIKKEKGKQTDDEQPEPRRTAAPARSNNSSSTGKGKPTSVGGVADVMNYFNRNDR